MRQSLKNIIFKKFINQNNNLAIIYKNNIKIIYIISYKYYFNKIKNSKKIEMTL